MDHSDATTSINRLSIVATAIAVAAMAAGAALRIVEFVRMRPLWLDEAMLALNIASRSFGGLVRPLDYDQTAPLMYLWIERAMLLVGGVSERSLRALPFVAGLVLLPAVWFVARRLAGATTAAIAAVLLAVSVTLVSFSAEAKQYGVDPAATLMVVWFATRVARSPADRRAWLQLGVAGVPALLLSQPVLFTLGGVVLGLAVDPDVRAARASRARLAAVSAAWAIGFGLLYVTLYRETAHSPYMQRFWEGTFLDPRAPDLGLRLRMFATAMFGAPVTVGATTASGWLVLAWALGIASLWRARRFAAVVVGGPTLLVVMASAFRFYPVMDRLMLFAAPLTLIAYAAAVARAVDLTPSRIRPAALVGVGGMVALANARTHATRIAQPVFSGVGKDVLADVDSMSHGDPVYLAARSLPLWVFYTTDWRAPDRERLAWAASIGRSGGPAHNNAPPSGRVRRSDAARLAREYRGRVELVGLPTGRQYVTSTRVLDPRLSPQDYATPAQPDSGWAELEVDRMASVATPRVWVFGSHMFALDGAEPGLVAELQRRGVRLIMERRQGTTVGYHVEFPSEP